MDFNEDIDVIKKTQSFETPKLTTAINKMGFLENEMELIKGRIN